MSLRTRAHARLDRHVPDFSRWEQREPARRLGSREQISGIEPRPDPGASVHVPAAAIREMRIREPGRPTPNAPLLMRIVRTPFSLSIGARVRTVVREPRPVAARERSSGPGWAFRDLIREIVNRVGPLRAIDHRPAPRPPPFSRARTP